MSALLLVLLFRPNTHTQCIAARNTDEIAIDDDDDEMEEVGEAKGPSGKQQMARMNLVEKAIPSAVSLCVQCVFVCAQDSE